MKRFLVAVAAVVGVLTAAAGIVDTTQVETANNYVLILNAHLESIRWRDNYEDAIIESLNNSHQAQVFTEHVKTLDVGTRAKLDSLTAKLFRKYVNRPRLVVFVGPAPMMLFADALNKHWKDIPILDCFHQNTMLNFDDFVSGKESAAPVKISDKQLKAKYNVTGISNPSYGKETVGLMLEVMPNISHIAYISDERIGSVVSRRRFAEMMKKNFPSISLEMIRSGESSTTDLLKKIRNFDTNTGIVFLNWALQGSSAEDYYEWNNLYKLLGYSSKAPVFSIHDMNVADGGIAGGVFVLQQDLSAHAIRLMNEVLNGKQPRDIPFCEPQEAHSYLNYEALQRYETYNIKYPGDAVYFQRPVNFFEKYRYALLSVGLIILGVVAFLLQRIYYLSKQRKDQKLKMEKEQSLYAAIRQRSYKLAMSLEASTLVSWMWNIESGDILWDRAKDIIENPESADTSVKMEWEAFLSLVVEADREKIKAMFRSLKNKKEDYVKEECRMTSSDGSTPKKANWYMFQAVVFERDKLGCPLSVIGTRMLITETKELEIELREARDKAEEASRLKSAFLANISHEIRTPLNAIVGFSAVLADAEDDDEKKELAEVVKHNNKLLLKLINDIVDISKLESSTADFKFTTERLNKLIVNIGKKYEDEIDKSKIKLKITAPLEDDEVYIEKHCLSQVLNNFMSNAVKFTTEGEIELGYYLPESGLIRFYVKDTGCGIPEDQLNTIFGRFVKLNTFEQGTGLGLSVCDLIAQKLGGEVGVYSKFREGSEFWFDMPLVDSLQDATEDDKGLAPKVLILVAEDSQSNFMVLKSILAGYDLIHAWNGQEALELFKERSPQLVLMDVKMPIMDGYAATAAIKKIAPNVPIIALSAYTLDHEKDKLAKQGFTEYEPKPVNKDSLVVKISKILNANDDK